MVALDLGFNQRRSGKQRIHLLIIKADQITNEL
jgi:hypothetical protein